ncbi:MAG: hypothetical protein GY742_10265 [Hyphomicrobiales bacterium]|nr:hypothetical protein [Hyphomicrobiales bacterium]
MNIVNIIRLGKSVKAEIAATKKQRTKYYFAFYQLGEKSDRQGVISSNVLHNLPGFTDQ